MKAEKDLTLKDYILMVDRGEGGWGLGEKEALPNSRGYLFLLWGYRLRVRL